MEIQIQVEVTFSWSNSIHLEQNNGQNNWGLLLMIEEMELPQILQVISM
jgi:hypothetical protein